jgi:hypothetical protein
MYSQGACTKATVDGAKRPSGKPFEVCVKDAKREEVELALPSKTYLFHLASASTRTRYTPALLSLSADGCLLTPSFNPDARTYDCAVSCEVGAHALIGAVRPEIDDYAIAVLTASGSGGRSPYTVLATDPHTIAREVQLDENLAPKPVRIMVGDRVYVGDAVGLDSAVTVYHVTVRCRGQDFVLTTSTSPAPGTGQSSERHSVEAICLLILFGSILVVFICMMPGQARQVLLRFLEWTTGSDDPFYSCRTVNCTPRFSSLRKAPMETPRSDGAALSELPAPVSTRRTPRPSPSAAPFVGR